MYRSRSEYDYEEQQKRTSSLTDLNQRLLKTGGGSVQTKKTFIRVQPPTYEDLRILSVKPVEQTHNFKERPTLFVQHFVVVVIQLCNETILKEKLPLKEFPKFILNSHKRNYQAWLALATKEDDSIVEATTTREVEELREVYTRAREGRVDTEV